MGMGETATKGETTVSQFRVLQVAAFFRADKESQARGEGMDAYIDFRDKPEDGFGFVVSLEAQMALWDRRETAASVLRRLERLSRHRDRVMQNLNLVAGFIMDVHWLQRRRYLPADEGNGTIFALIVGENQMVTSEKHPLLIDWENDLTGPAAADVTDLVKCGPRAADALKAVIDHARGTPPKAGGIPS
jgi:hypothetical protein